MPERWKCETKRKQNFKIRKMCSLCILQKVRTLRVWLNAEEISMDRNWDTVGEGPQRQSGQGRPSRHRPEWKMGVGPKAPTGLPRPGLPGGQSTEPKRITPEP